MTSVVVRTVTLLLPLLAGCFLMRQAPPPGPKAGEPLRTWERDNRVGVGRVIWARNDTTIALTVTKLILTDCNATVPACGTLYPNVTVAPGQTVELLTIRPAQGDHVSYQFELEYQWQERR